MNIKEKIEKCNTLKNVTNKDKWWLELCTGKCWNPNVQPIISELKMIYDNKWYRELRNMRNGFGPCALSMIGGMQSTISNILDIGENLRVLGGIKNLDSELIHRLKNPTDFLDTWVEIDIIACFAKAGFPIILHPKLPNGRYSDAKVKVNGKWIWVEITHLDMMQNERNDFKSCAELVQMIEDCIPGKRLMGRIKFLTTVKSNPIILFKRIINEIKAVYLKNGLPINLELDSEKVIVNLYESQGGLGICVEGFHTIELPNIGKHLVKRTLKEYKQLPEDGPGIIITNPSSLLDPQIGLGMEERLRGLFTPEMHQRVSGIIFVNRRVKRSGFIKDHPIPIINEFAKKRCDRSIEKLSNALWFF
jgi:hypothetical protein